MRSCQCINITWFLATVATLAAGCSDPPYQRGVDVLGGDLVAAVIRGAETVEVFRLNDGPYSENFADYAVAEGPLPVRWELASSLADELTSDRCYLDAEFRCQPAYHLQTRFVRRADQVDIMYCFNCYDLAVFHNQRFVGQGNFHSRQAQFTRLAKQLLPNDQALQSLP